MNAVVQRSTPLSKASMALFVAIVLGLAYMPWAGNDGLLGLLTEFLFYLALAQLWNLLAGFAGVVSLGQQAYVGLGGYALFTVLTFWEVHPGWGLLAAGVVGGIVAIPVATIVFRLNGAYLAIGTWVIAEVFRLGFSQVADLGAGSGTSLPVTVAYDLEFEKLSRDGLIFLVALVLCVAATLGTYFLLRSRFGLALTAIRDNAIAARSSAVDSQRIQKMVYFGVAVATSLLGAVIYLSKFRISPSAAFDINWTSYVIFIVVIGGVGTLEGPIIGSIIFFVLREYLSDLGSLYLLILGVIAVFIMLQMPNGIWGTLSKRFNIELFPLQRRLVLDKLLSKSKPDNH